MPKVHLTQHFADNPPVPKDKPKDDQDVHAKIFCFVHKQRRLQNKIQPAKKRSRTRLPDTALQRYRGNAGGFQKLSISPFRHSISRFVKDRDKEACPGRTCS